MDRTRAELIVTSRDPAQQPTNPGIDKTLIRALVRGYAMRTKLESGEARSGPDLMEQILDGLQPTRPQIGHICDGKLPLDWAEQRELFAGLPR